jgi:hypothetical protein
MLTSSFNRSSVGWVFPIVLWSIFTLILRPKNFQDINDYIFGIWIKEIKKVAWHLFGLESFCKHSIPQGCLYPFVHLPRIPRCEHMEHKQIKWSLYFALHGVFQTSTPSPCLRNETWWGFGHEWNVILEPFPWLKEVAHSYTRKFIIF